MRILLIEDEVKIAAAITKGLTLEGYAVDAHHDGKEGLSFALTEPYDLVIVDRMLPGVKDGLEIVRTMREKDIMTPVLCLTALGGVGDTVSGLNAGADDYLTKPFAFEELFARVRALMRRPDSKRVDEIKVGDLTIDLGAHTVYRAEKEIILSPTEYALLEYLVRNVGRALSKDQIIAHVWNYDADILPNTVEAYIGYLRAKIEKPFAKLPALIKTIRGVGYRLEVAK